MHLERIARALEGIRESLFAIMVIEGVRFVIERWPF